MRRTARFYRKTLLLAVFGGGVMFANGCLNFLLSINVCGTVLATCTPEDQLLLVFPFLEVPDFDADPSCTIPTGCFDRDDDQFDDGSFPFGGGPPVEPEDPAGGGVGGGGGGGGGI